MAGIPHYAGAYVSGTEVTPDFLREAGLVENLCRAGVDVHDAGNVKLPDYWPRHNIPPIRNWPAPRMLWDVLRDEARGWLGTDSFALMIGGDCSLIVGTAQAHRELYGSQAYLLVIDGHLDAIAPSGTRCLGAAGMGLWFLLQDPGVWMEISGWTKDRVQVVGCQKMPDTTYGVGITTLEQLQSQGAANGIHTVLASIPEDAKILVHFDVDVMHKEAMGAAYSPSETGLSLAEAEELLTAVLSDPRVVGMEVTEFSALRDVTGENAERLVHLLTTALASRMAAAHC